MLSVASVWKKGSVSPRLLGKAFMQREGKFIQRAALDVGTNKNLNSADASESERALAVPTAGC